MKRFLPILILLVAAVGMTCCPLPVSARVAAESTQEGLRRTAGAVSPYINKVYEYRPAPGQFTNVLPEYEAGDTEADMIRKVEQQIVDTIGTTNYICLGGWGGYVTFGFDHRIQNVAGQADFEVAGNYFAGRRFANPYETKNASGTFSHDTIQAGSSEPGIIWVSRDDNGDGMPNDTWYEIAGSEYPYSTRGYSVTYFRPAADSCNVTGLDLNGDTITVVHNGFHSQIYYPEWLQEDSYTLMGTIMPTTIIPGTMVLLTMDYGYADNASLGSAENGINIDWAVDGDGNPARLDGIDFVRIQTGVSQDGGMMGETSTEVCGARDLHFGTALEECTNSAFSAQKLLLNGRIIIRLGEQDYDILGNNL